MRSGLKAVARAVLPHSIYRRYRQRKIAAIIAGYAPREVTHTYGQQTLSLRLEDPLAEAWYDHDWREPEMISFLRERDAICPGGIVFDLGAHQGVVAIMFANVVGATGRVVAVEAEPHNARVAAVNCELNHVANVTLIHAAAAANEGFTTFAEGLTGQVDERASAGTVMVPTVTVDGLARIHGTPDVVVIDVEGYEEQVLKGARDTLANGSTNFIVEVHDASTLNAFQATADAVLSHFRNFDKYLATEDDHPFVALTSAPPDERFFLAATPIS